ncbi:MAG TPA: Fe-S cluster assembly protein SufD, partial [Acidimicrobiales bacterium]
MAALPGPEWLREARARAWERFASSDRPRADEEVWRYSRIDDFDLGAYVPAAPVPASSPVGRLPDAVEAVGRRSGLIVIHNGWVERAEVDPDLAASGVVVGPLAREPEAPGHWPAGGPDAYVDWAGAFMANGVLVRVPRRVVVPYPIVVVNYIDGDGAAVAGRTHVETGEGAEVTVVEHSGSADVVAVAAPVVVLDAGDGSHLAHLSVQELGRRVWQLGYQTSRTGRDATLQSFAVALGGAYARLRTDARMEGSGATNNLLAAYFGDGDQMHDFRTLQEHVAPKTTSDLLFKGALRDTAHSVYSGLIRVRRGAAGTNAFQTNRNLVLSEGAHADSVPNLEIDENDVSCSHASAVGPIDEEQRYYLESRGIPSDAAERLIVLGFFEDIVGRAPVAGVASVL